MYTENLCFCTRLLSVFPFKHSRLQYIFFQQSTIVQIYYLVCSWFFFIKLHYVFVMAIISQCWTNQLISGWLLVLFFYTLFVQMVVSQAWSMTSTCCRYVVWTVHCGLNQHVRFAFDFFFFKPLAFIKYFTDDIHLYMESYLSLTTSLCI